MLSIIVPVYNTSRYLNKCVDSLLQQTYTDIEIILVNDGSTDDSGKICDEYSKKDSRVKIIHKNNGGLISAWVEGTKQCHGEYVGYVDSDDWVENTYFEKLMRPIKLYNCDVSICGFTVMGKNKNIVDPALCAEGIYNGESIEQLKQNYYNGYNIQNSRWTKIFDKELILSHVDELDYSITLCEDQTITVRAILDASSIYISRTYGYYYRVNDSSMSHLFNQKLLSNFEKVYVSVTQAFEKKGYMNEYVLQSFVNEAISVIGLIIYSSESIKKRVQYLQLFRNQQSVNYLFSSETSIGIKKKWKIIYYMVKFRFDYVLCALATIINLYKKWKK